jgi:hypothetical protein
MAQDAARLPLVGALRINTAANIEPIATMLRDALGLSAISMGRLSALNSD